MKSNPGGIIQIKDISGFEEYIADIESSITSVINQDTLDSRGILIIGPPGTGKSMLIEALQNEYADRLFIHHINSLISKSNNRDLTNISQKIVDRSPSLILIDDVDKLCKNKKEQAEMYSFLRSLLIWNSSSDILVIATCQSDASVPENFLKHSLLDRKIEFSIPSPASRKQILINILKRFKCNLTEDQISEISDMAHGFTGSDLNRLCMEADCKRIERRTNNSRIIFIDFQQSFCNVKPSSVAEFSFKVPNVKWSDIGGMEEVKEAVKEMVEWPLKYPEKLKRFKLIPPRGILMYGPPGCCKTMIAKALANESHCNFIIVKQAEVFNKYVGESEKSISELFKKARAAAPCILFFDEIETIVPVRGSSRGSTNVSDRVVTQILLEIDGVDVLEQGVCVIAATNNPSKIDPSLLRPGRLDRLIYVPLPDAPTRKEIFRITLQNKPISSDVDLEYLVDRTENYTGAEISAVCTEACMCAMKEMLSNTSTNEEFNSPILPVSMKHFLHALTYVQPRTTQEMLNVFEDYRKKFKLQNFFM